MSDRVLVLQHDEGVPPGILGEWMAARGLEADVVMVRELDAPVPLDGYAAIATLGSVASVNDGDDWIARETAILREALATDVPVLGLCFGGQSLAYAAGAGIRRADRTEIGFVTIESDEPGLVPAGPWLAWHHDTFDLPPGASEVARSEVCLHAFALGPHLGLQFHPEADAPIVTEWAEKNPDDLEGVGIDPAELVAEVAERDDESRARAFRLFDAFWERAHP